MDREVLTFPAKYARYGATGFISYNWLRFRSHLRDGWRAFAEWAAVTFGKCLCHRSKHFHAAFVSLGYNCELAFRYFRSNGFCDSGLFQWGTSSSIDNLIYALDHLDLLFTGEIRDPNPLYECANTGIRQHGKEVSPRTAAEVKSGREELRGRMSYLKDKFLRTLRDGRALVAYKVRTSEYLDDGAEDRLNRLLATLKRLGMSDATFLLVCEDACRAKSVRLDCPNAYVRFVKSFNPDPNVTAAELGDSVGWRLIFNEFRPRAIKKQKHKFKFEK